MFERDYRDMAAGLLMAATGGFVAVYASTQYNLGTFRNMGPGMFPMLAGSVLIFLGGLLAVTAFFRAGPMPKIRISTPIFILASIAAFALLIRNFGMLPAVVAVTLIASLAELKVRPVSLALLAAGLCLGTWLIFPLGLGLNIPMLRWPF